jgi:hypothetical protein
MVLDAKGIQLYSQCFLKAAWVQCSASSASSTPGRVVAGVELVQKIVKGQFDVPASFGTGNPFCIWYNMLAA